VQTNPNAPQPDGAVADRALGRIYPMPWIEVEIGIASGIPASIPIPISGMTHPNRPGYLVQAIR